METGSGGRFEVPHDVGMGLGTELVMKPFASGKSPKLIFDAPFEALGELRAKAKDRDVPVVRHRVTDEEEDPEINTADYESRRTLHLDEVVVKRKAPYYLRRDKLYGYLDSIHTMKSGVWVCCLGHAPTGAGYINDYLTGYTHHPNGYCMPEKKYAPKIGETYRAIKYSGTTQDDYVIDIQTVVYKGDILSQEELLKEAGLFADQGYTRPYNFQNWDPEEWLDGVDDIRNTLLWAPQLETNSEGTLDIEFYTSDIASNFRISGIAYTQDGQFADLDNAVFEVK